MKCNRPNLYYDGKIMSFNPKIAHHDSTILINCGKCLACKVNHSRSWAVKCDLESKRWSNNYFITFTYSDEFVPKNEHGIKILKKEDVQKMLKRIRKDFEKNGWGKIKYLYCGEYGPKTYRPHYHMILFTNHKFDDFELHSINEWGDELYVSKQWEKYWPWGFHLIGSVSANAGAYVARYTVKKSIKKEKSASNDGLPKEFINMSLKDGGIGWNEFLTNKYWLKNGTLHYVTNIKNDIKIKYCNIPKYWIRKLENVLDKPDFDFIKNTRISSAKMNLRYELQKKSASEIANSNKLKVFDEIYNIENNFLKKKI